MPSLDHIPSLVRLVFDIFAGMAVFSALGVVLSRYPVRAALFLVLTFVAVAGAWMVLEAEFLSLVLIFVYVGAVMTLFLFVVMMFNRDQVKLPVHLKRLWPLTTALGVTIATVLGYALWHGMVAELPAKLYGAQQLPHTQALGRVLYTEYLLPFECAAVVLLVAMISAIHLTFRGPRQRLVQSVREQVSVTKSERLKIIAMESRS